MEGCLLRVYLHESQRCHRRLAWEWLLDQANQMGIRGGSAFKAMGGFGHHHHLQEAKFYELAGDLGVMVSTWSPSKLQALVALLRQERIRPCPFADSGPVWGGESGCGRGAPARRNRMA